MKRNKKNAQLPRRNFKFNFQNKENPRELSSPIHYSKNQKNSKHKHKQENQIDENFIHE